MLVNLNDILKKAQKEHYCVGLFNTTDTDMLEAAISAAEELSSPIIIGTAEVLLPYGELQLIAPSILARAKAAKVPVVVHYDHGLTFDRCIEALQLGFTSVMFDGSAGAYDKNIADTCEIVKIAHAMGATVEGEIGHVGDAGKDDPSSTEFYTTVKQATDYINATGVDALAIAIGTAHGAYRVKPKLDIPRLHDIRAAVDTPLVLHGGSGLPVEEIQAGIAGGIAKLNIFTDLCIAGENACRDALAEGLDYLHMRAKKVDYIREAVKEKMRLFGSVGKA